MIIVDSLLKKRAVEGRPIRVGLIGAGAMGRGLANQIINSVPGMRLAAIANRTPERAVAAYANAGVARVDEVATVGALEDGIDAGRAVVTGDARLLCEADSIDCLVDATGALEFGATITLEAFRCGKSLVTMNAELDATIGPLLHKRSVEARVLFTASDGDQPGAQMNLYRFVRAVGLRPLVCGNVKGMLDAHRNPTTQAGFAAKWEQNPYMVTSFADGTKLSFEQATVANATGMTVARRGMGGLAHMGHVDDLVRAYDVAELERLGGVVDYCLGAKPGPGIYVLATHDDPKQRHYLNLYKLGEGPLYCFYTPYHLCHFEVPFSIARAVLLNDPVMQPLDGPRVEVVATAKVDLARDDVIDGIGGYKCYGQCESYPIAQHERLLPMGLSLGCRLRRAVPRDHVISYDDVDLPGRSLIETLRAEQDRLFPSVKSAVPAWRGA